jgi:hypothetical protein
MKTMTCRQLGGACDMEFHANSFEEMAELSKNHGMDMFQKGDEAHLKTDLEGFVKLCFSKFPIQYYAKKEIYFILDSVNNHTFDYCHHPA